MSPGRGKWSALSGCLIVASCASVASAKEPAPLQVGFEYEAQAELGCPEATELRAAVVRQLGYDPFSADTGAPEHRIRVVVTRVDSGLEGRIDWVDQQGRSEGERRLASSSAECAELASGLAFAVAVQIQLRAAPPEPVAEPAPAPAPAAPPRPEPKAAAPPVAAPRRLVLLGLGVTFEYGLAPRVSPGLRAFGAATEGIGWLEAGVQATTPTTLELADGTGFTANELSVWLSPCVRTPPLGWCAAAMVGKLQVHGQGVDQVRSPSALLAAAGAKLELFWPTFNRVGAIAYAQALATLTPQDIKLNQTEVWSTAPVVFGVGVDLAAIF